MAELVWTQSNAACQEHHLCCRLQTEGLPWTELMDASLLAACSEHGVTATDIIAACQRVPMDGALQEVSPLAAAFMSLPLNLYPLTARPEPGGLVLTKCHCHGCRRDWLVTVSHGCTGTARGWSTESSCHSNPERC